MINSTWLLIFGAFLVMTDYTVQKTGLPTFRELTTPSKKIQYDTIFYDRIERVGEYYLPVPDTFIYVLND